jgi:hypothetical protein
MDDLYINKWGREYKMLTKYFIGEMYVLKLKQSDRRGFSARSTGAVDTKSLPTRSFKSRSHLEKISSSCIRFGEYESLNFSIAMLPEDIALFHALYRTSIKGRRDLMKIMFSDDGVQKIDNSYTSRVAEIFNVEMKSLGVRVNFEDEDNVVKVLNNDEVRVHHYKGKEYLMSDYEFFMLERIDDIREEILSEHPILTKSVLDMMIEKKLKDNDVVNGPLSEEVSESFLAMVEKENEEVVKRLKEERINKEAEEKKDEEKRDEEKDPQCN